MARNIFRWIGNAGRKVWDIVGDNLARIPDVLIGSAMGLLALGAAGMLIWFWTALRPGDVSLPSDMLMTALLSIALLLAVYTFGATSVAMLRQNWSFPDWFGSSALAAGVVMLVSFLGFMLIPLTSIPKMIDGEVLATLQSATVVVAQTPGATAVAGAAQGSTATPLPTAIVTAATAQTNTAGLPVHTCTYSTVAVPAILRNTSEYSDWDGRQVCAFPIDPNRNGKWIIYFFYEGEGYPLAKSSSLIVNNDGQPGLLGYGDARQLAQMIGMEVSGLTPLPTPAITPMPSIIYLGGDTDNLVYTTQDRVRLRQEPGSAGKAIAALPDDLELIVTGDPVLMDGREWVPVQLQGYVDGSPKGTTGWVAIELLRPNVGE